MAQLLVRNLDDEVVQRLRNRAAAHSRSVEAEHRAILEDALRPAGTGFFDVAERLQTATEGRLYTDSAVLVRADRQRDDIS